MHTHDPNEAGSANHIFQIRKMLILNALYNAPYKPSIMFILNYVILTLYLHKKYDHNRYKTWLTLF